jgi:hypothetical protein
MKTKLNIICVLIFVVILADIMGGFFDFNIGKNAADHEMGVHHDNAENMVLDADMVKLIPVADKRTAIQVTNKVTGKKVNAWPTEMYVEPETYESYLDSGWAYVAETIAAILGVVCLIGALGAFVVFIVRVNRGQIFDKKNISLLRLIGIGLLAYGVIVAVWDVLAQMQAAAKFRLEGYLVDWVGGITYTPILLGLIAFVAAQVFAMSQKMKEDQDLTI